MSPDERASHLRSLLQSLPRSVRDAHPRLVLAPEFGVSHTSGPGPASLTVGRRTAGLFSLLPPQLAARDDLIHLLARVTAYANKACGIDLTTTLTAPTTTTPPKTLPPETVPPESLPPETLSPDGPVGPEAPTGSSSVTVNPNS